MIAYSFCNPERNHTASMVLSVLIHQILEQFPEIIKSIHDYDHKRYLPVNKNGPQGLQTHKHRNSQYLWNILEKDVSESKVRRVFLIIDALDECDEQSQKVLLSFFSSILRSSSNFKILFSSRPNDVMKHQLRNYLSQHPQHFKHAPLEAYDDEILKDISRYIDFEIQHLDRLTTSDQRLIRKKLDDEQSAVFLPVALLFAQIASESTRAVSEILADLPRDLEKLYERLVTQLPDTQHTPRLLLQLLLYTFGPVTIYDLALYVKFALAPDVTIA